MSEFTIVEGATSAEAVLRSKSRKVEKLLVDEAMSERKKTSLYALFARARNMGVPIEYVSHEKIDELCSGTTHGGIVAVVGEREYLSLDELSEKKQNGFFALLDGIEDPFNFGQAIRALYAAGADGILLPERNWMSASSVVARSSAGASEYIPACVCDVISAATELKKDGYKIVCTDHSASAVSMTKANLKRPLLLVVGGEKRGISAKLKALADVTVQIDYGRSFNASLGAAEASAVLAFEVLRQNSNTATENKDER